MPWSSPGRGGSEAARRAAGARHSDEFLPVVMHELRVLTLRAAPDEAEPVQVPSADALGVRVWRDRSLGACCPSSRRAAAAAACRPITLVLLWAALVAVSAAAPAHALGFIAQDEAGIGGDARLREATLDRMVELGATDVRVFVQHAHRSRGHANFVATGRQRPLKDYGPIFASIRARGLRVYANLSWYGESDPRRIAAWAAEAAAALAPHVDTWSILNEPDLSLMAGDCTPAQHHRMVTTGAVKTHRVKRYEFVRVSPRSNAKGLRYRRVVRVFKIADKHKRVVRYISTARKRGRYIRRPFFHTLAGMPEEPITIALACQKATAGQAYTRILEATTPVLRAADPSARIVGGELSPTPGAYDFAHQVDWSHVDVAAIHPYFGHAFSIENVGHEDLGLPRRVLVSEFGVQTWEPDRIGLIRRAWKLAASSELEAMAQYMIWHATIDYGWDTGLIAPGRTTGAAFEAVKQSRARTVSPANSVGAAPGSAAPDEG